MRVDVVIPSLPPSLNKIVPFNARHRATHPDAVAFQEVVFAALFPHRDAFDGVDALHVVCLFLVPDRRRRDVDNLLKSLFDSLASAIRIDDSRILSVYVAKRHIPRTSAVRLIVSDAPLVSLDHLWDGFPQ